MANENIPSPPPVIKRKRPEWTRQTRRYKVITPLFGGGVVPGETDPVTVIRGSAVRGHLRFWWRATRGGEFSDLAAMKKYEDDLWGSASNASEVSLDVTVRDRGKRFVVRRGDEELPVGHPSSDYGYVAFPLEDDQYVREGIKFTLVLTYPTKFDDDIAATLWAWETFGGIGARTRRGFGALACTRVTVDGETQQGRGLEDDVLKQIKNEAKHHVSSGTFPADLPHLSRQLDDLRITTRKYSNADEAWKALIKKLKDFRQSRRPSASDTPPNVPGRSYWPEPDAIRRIFKTPSHARHGKPVSKTDKFPRAAFGLPIIFHFKDNDDPGQTSLQGANDERLASPLIIRPLLCTNNQAVGLVLVLDAPRHPPSGVKLQNAPGNPTVTVDLDSGPPNEADFPPLNGETDVLKAFLETIN